MIDQMVLGDRKNLTGVIGATQFASDISPALLKSASQTGLVFVLGLQGDPKTAEDNMAFLKQMGIDQMRLKDMAADSYSVTNSLGFKVSKIHMIDSRRRITSFFPNISLPAMNLTTR